MSFYEKVFHMKLPVTWILRPCIYNTENILIMKRLAYGNLSKKLGNFGTLYRNSMFWVSVSVSISNGIWLNDFFFPRVLTRCDLISCINGEHLNLIQIKNKAKTIIKNLIKDFVN